MAFGAFLVRFQKIVFFQNFGGPFLPSQGAVPVGTERSIHGRPTVTCNKSWLHTTNSWLRHQERLMIAEVGVADREVGDGVSFLFCLSKKCLLGGPPLFSIHQSMQTKLLQYHLATRRNRSRLNARPRHSRVVCSLHRGRHHCVVCPQLNALVHVSSALSPPNHRAKCTRPKVC